MNPYRTLPPRSFWRTAVAEPDTESFSDVWTPAFAIGQDDPVVTAGSCFARHIGRALLDRGMNWRDAEPAPPGLTAAERQARHYGLFSFRTGNIYTAASLLQWLTWAYGEAEPPAEVWEEDGRYFDPCRPAVEPDGFATPEAVYAARTATLNAVREALGSASVFVFTLGLTEAWQDRAEGTIHPVCPGTVRGTFDAGRHVFRNFTFQEVYRDLSAALELVRRTNPRLRILLTVSPVPLTATATGDHVLSATSYSKSVLRAVAGQLANELGYVDYFPSYELITGFPIKAAFFEQNMRTVTAEGVAFVMRHFFEALAQRPIEPAVAHRTQLQAREEFWCEDAVLDYYNAH